MAFARRILGGLALVSLAATACSSGDDDVDGPEPIGALEQGATPTTVADAVSMTCTTGSVKALSLQIIEEASCLQPGAFSKMPDLPNLDVPTNVFPYLEEPARDRLVLALEANPSKTMTVNSMLRTASQQYLLYRWYQLGKCGISLAAKPGRSNHETGLAFDIGEYSAWKSALKAKGFKWLGSNDPWHFDYVGPGAVDHRGVDVEAFQRLWNRNHPDDEIAEDGDWGPMTEARMKKSPAAGFPKGAQCSQPDPDG